MIYVIAAAIISFGFGWAIGFAQGRGIGYMVGEELERRKWKRRQPGPPSP